MTTSKHHSFSTEVAKEYGIDSAILIHHFQDWISFNKRKKQNFNDDRTWTYQTVEEMRTYFSYMSSDRIRSALDLLCTGKTRHMKSVKHEPVLMRSNYNKSKCDRTYWYAFVDESKWIESSVKGEVS